MTFPEVCKKPSDVLYKTKGGFDKNDFTFSSKRLYVYWELYR